MSKLSEKYVKVDGDAMAEKMADILMDDKISTCDMMESIVYYRDNAEKFTKEELVDKIVEVFTNQTPEAIIDEVLNNCEI